MHNSRRVTAPTTENLPGYTAATRRPFDGAHRAGRAGQEQRTLGRISRRRNRSAA
jgi:hypothetical protein